MSQDETEALQGGPAGPTDEAAPGDRRTDAHPPNQATEAIDVTTPPRILGGRYEVGELIGRGGMADVHLGHDNRLGRQVAIKILRSDLARDANFLMRFRREAQSAAGLNHPSIVAIFDSGEDETTVEGPGGHPTTLPYMVMEYIDGETLRQQLSRRHQFEPGDAIRVTESILDALAYSHRMGIVHRDIKPANVMVTATGAIKVMDFGIARAIADTAATMTQTQSVVGTAQYLSPEQAQGQTVDARSDLYSTGCLLFELLAGRPPFVGDSPVAIAYQHVGELPQPPSVWNREVGGDLDAVTLHALEKDREVRYQDASAFRLDLENVRLGRPISAAALATGAAVGAAATQTLPSAYAVAGTPTAVQAPVGTGLPPVGRDEDEDRKGGGKRTALIAVLALLILGLIGWGAATWFGNQTPEVVNVAVPRITGMDEETALSTLRTANLQGQKSTAASTTVPEGNVIAQDPAAGTQVAENSTIRFVLSRGPDNGAVPDVTGFDKNEAQKALEDAGFKVSDFVEENTPDQPKDKVTKTDPPANSQVAQGSSIKVYYATGNVQVPQGLVGRDWAIAASTLNDAGVNPVRQDVESDKAPGTVLEVAREGAVVKAGTDITVKVAKAKATPIPTVTVTAPPPTPTGTDTPTDTGTTAP
ncbi:serine/threonine-protein kinase [Humibacillus xanthopallidus]|uniref:non-specific serine/threonine protein kinase n=1 Tax=Humibacillus xanthopallidus TaxID=412689 RepID=A0A543PKB8_9MICO|nr:Stk1 family PASTA domain-containing Ser/Thr kinase [Humibacillus xanthopallidus]TQN44503.1 serine/threonine-protein kinase [Humibacillus xanthopallidus]